MSKSDPAFLAKMEQESKTQQQLFINNIASRLGRTSAGAKPEHPFKGAPEFWTTYELGQEEKITRFMDNWHAAGGYAERVGGMSELPAVIARILRELKAGSTIRQDLPELEQLALADELPELEHFVWDGLTAEGSLASAARADAGIAFVDHAVAYTGSIVVTSSTQKGRSVTLLPNILIAVIPAERMKTRLGEVMQTVSEFPEENFPAGVHFISGPSRSSDIENDLTIGVHGPGIAYALIVGQA